MKNSNSYLLSDPATGLKPNAARASVPAAFSIPHIQKNGPGQAFGSIAEKTSSAVPPLKYLLVKGYNHSGLNE